MPPGWCQATTVDRERWLLSVVTEAPRREIRLFVNWIAAVTR